jgi:hypothetical protein
MLWGRLAADDPAFTWEGDSEQARATLGRALTP